MRKINFSIIDTRQLTINSLQYFSFQDYLIFNAFLSVSCSRLFFPFPHSTYEDFLVWIGSGHKYSPFYENFSVACRLCAFHAVFYVLFLVESRSCRVSRRGKETILFKANNFMSSIPKFKRNNFSYICFISWVSTMGSSNVILLQWNFL